MYVKMQVNEASRTKCQLLRILGVPYKRVTGMYSVAAYVVNTVLVVKCLFLSSSWPVQCA